MRSCHRRRWLGRETTMSTVPPADQATTIVRDTIVSGLRSAAADSGYALSDPIAGSRSGEFVLAGFLDQSEYPHLVVREADDEGGRPDSRDGVWEHRYDVRIDCLATSRDEAFDLRDGVREWFQVDTTTLRSAGYEDVEISSSTPLSWDDTNGVASCQLEYSGTVYTA